MFYIYYHSSIFLYFLLYDNFDDPVNGLCPVPYSEDMYAQDSIDLLQNSGIQFKKHEEDGIDPLDFAELLMSSGIVLMDNIKWLCFHSGYDFGYLIKLLTDQNLPTNENDFFDLLHTYFPNIYDIKYLMKSCKSLKGGLQEVAEQLDIRRVGPQHQAGSDALLTGTAFFKMREVFDIKTHLSGTHSKYRLNQTLYQYHFLSTIIAPINVD